MQSRKSIDDLIKDKSKLPLPVPDANALWQDMLAKLDDRPPAPPGPAKAIPLFVFWTSSKTFRSWSIAFAGLAVLSAWVLLFHPGKPEEPVSAFFDLPIAVIDEQKSTPENARLDAAPAEKNVLSAQSTAGRSRSGIANPSPAEPASSRPSIPAGSAASRAARQRAQAIALAISGAGFVPPTATTDQSGQKPNGAITQAAATVQPDVPKSPSQVPDGVVATGSMTKIEPFQPLDTLPPAPVHDMPVLVQSADISRLLAGKLICLSAPPLRWSFVVYAGCEPLKTKTDDGLPGYYLLNAGVGVRKAFRHSWYGQADISLNQFQTPYLSQKTVKYATLNANDLAIDSVQPVSVAGLSLNLSAGKQFRTGISVYAGIQAGYLIRSKVKSFNTYYQDTQFNGVKSSTETLPGSTKIPDWIRPLDLGLRLGVEQHIIAGLYAGAMVRQGLIDMTRYADGYTTYTNFVVYAGYRF